MIPLGQIPNHFFKQSERLVTYSELTIGLMSRVFVNGPGDQFSIPGGVIVKIGGGGINK